MTRMIYNGEPCEAVTGYYRDTELIVHRIPVERPGRVVLK